jgi:hypothetical protein
MRTLREVESYSARSRQVEISITSWSNRCDKQFVENPLIDDCVAVGAIIPSAANWMRTGSSKINYTKHVGL